MALLSEVEQFIADSGLTTEQAHQMRSIFESNPGAQEKTKGGLLRQSDYSRHMNDVKKAEDDLAAKNKKLDDEFARLAQYGADESEKSLKLQREVEAGVAKLSKAQSRLKRAVEVYGMPEDEMKEIFGDAAPTAPVTSPAPQGDDVPMTIGEFKKQATQFANQLAILPAIQQKIMVEHYNLYGKFPDDMTQLVQDAIKSGRKLEDAASEHFKFGERREKIKEDAIEAKYKKQYDEELNKRLSEAHLPTSTRPAPSGARILNIPPRPAPAAAAPASTPAPQAGNRSQRALSAQNRISTVSKAVSAFREGKYAAVK